MKESQSSQSQVRYIWRSPMLQAIGTMRAAGQIYCANELEQLWKILHEHDPTERSELKIVQALIENQAEEMPEVDVEELRASAKKEYDRLVSEGRIEERRTPFGVLRILKPLLLLGDK